MPHFRAAAFAFVAVVGALSAQETVYVHRVAGREVGRVAVVRASHALRGEGSAAGEGARVVGSVETAADGRVVAYDRELRGKGGALVGRVSVTSTDEGARIREAGPLGSRTRSVPGGAFDAVVDPVFPEAMLAVLGDRRVGSFRALLVADGEIRTVVVEARGEAARFVDLPGGGLTVRYDAAGVTSIALPGAEPREIRRADAAPTTTPAPDVGVEERLAVEAGPGVKLGATLLRPAKPVSPPAVVVLVGDAGATDRDGVGGGRHAPTLRLLAEELARLGVASVRADKRGMGESVGPEPGLADLGSDAAALLERARVAVGAESRRTAFVGHGEGAVVAAEAATSRPTVPAGGLVLLAGPGRSLADGLEARLRARLASAGEALDAIEDECARLRDELAQLREDLPPGATPAPGEKLLRDLVRLDPATQLTRARLPVLVVHAAEDPEVPAAHVALLRASLAFSQGRIRFHTVDRADHDLLLAGERPGGARADGASADAARPLHPSVAALVVDFLGWR